jgi:hypothetical protein
MKYIVMLAALLMMVAGAVAQDNLWITNNNQYANGNAYTAIDQFASNNANFEAAYGQTLIQTNTQDASGNYGVTQIQQTASNFGKMGPNLPIATETNWQRANANAYGSIDQTAMNTFDVDAAVSMESYNTQDAYGNYNSQITQSAKNDADVESAIGAEVEIENAQTANYNAGSTIEQIAYNSLISDPRHHNIPTSLEEANKQEANSNYGGSFGQEAFNVIESRNVDYDQNIPSAETESPNNFQQADSNYLSTIEQEAVNGIEPLETNDYVVVPNHGLGN